MNNITQEDLERLEQIEKMKKTVMRKILTKEALERIGRVRYVKPELATELELYLLQLYQAGQIKSVIDDKQLKQILESVRNKKSFKIIR